MYTETTTSIPGSQFQAQGAADSDHFSINPNQFFGCPFFFDPYPIYDPK